MTDDPIIRQAGKRGATFGTPRAPIVRFGDLFNASTLPTPPPVFGHYHSSLFHLSDDHTQLGMLGNDSCSDCVFAMGAHRVMYWAAANGREVRFSKKSVVQSYSEMTGYRSWNPFSDQGTDMSLFPDWWRLNGILDAAGNRHRIDAWVALRVGDWQLFKLAMWLFDGLDLGVLLPSDAEADFSRGKPWTGAQHGAPGAGHGIAAFGINSHNMVVTATWGGLQAMDLLWWGKYVTWVDCPLSIEALDAKGISPEHYDRTGLLSYISQFRQ